MRVSRGVSIPLGVLTIAPLAYLAVFLLYLIPRLQGLAGAGVASSHEFSELSRRVMWYHVSTVWFGFLLIAFYVAFVWRSRRVPQAKKSTWATLIIMGSLVTMPVFWYLYLWRDQPVEPKRTLDAHLSGAA